MELMSKDEVDPLPKPILKRLSYNRGRILLNQTENQSKIIETLNDEIDH